MENKEEEDLQRGTKEEGKRDFTLKRTIEGANFSLRLEADV